MDADEIYIVLWESFLAKEEIEISMIDLFFFKTILRTEVKIIQAVFSTI